MQHRANCSLQFDVALLTTQSAITKAPDQFDCSRQSRNNGKETKRDENDEDFLLPTSSVSLDLTIVK